MRVLVTGISGAIGSGLAGPLLDAGHEVLGLSRRAADERPGSWPAGVRVVGGDAVSGAGLADALAGVEVAYYLIHSMQTGPAESFTALDLRAAENFAAAAARAGVGRIVYLGGLVPPGTPSEHLASRLQVERVLLEAVPNSVALRASIVIGARSRSFRFLVRLVERMPVLVVPAWGVHRTAPVDQRDVLHCLVACATAPVGGRSLDLAGPEVVTYQQLIERIRDQLLLGRPAVRLPRIQLTPIASRVSSIIADEDHALIGPLMEGLSADLLPRPDCSACDALGVRPHSLDAAIERALREWEVIEPLRGR